MSFCTAVNCMDGRTQSAVISYLQDRFGAEFVDMVTEPGPCRILVEDPDGEQSRAILERCRISIEKHASVGMAVVAHHDCAGNPVSDEVQKFQVRKAVAFLKDQWKDLEIIGLWLGRDFEVNELNSA